MLSTLQLVLFKSVVSVLSDCVGACVFICSMLVPDLVLGYHFLRFIGMGISRRVVGQKERAALFHKPMVPFWVGAPPILEPILVVGLGCSLGGIRDFDKWPYGLVSTESLGPLPFPFLGPARIGQYAPGRPGRGL